MKRLCSLALAILPATAVACGDGPPHHVERPSHSGDAEASGASCERAIELDVYSRDAAPREEVASLGDYYKAYGFGVGINREYRLNLPYVLEDAPDVVRAAVQDAFPGVDLEAAAFTGTEDELQRLTAFIADFITSPIRNFIEGVRQNEGRPAFVVADRINQRDNGGTLAITLSPRLLERLRASEQEASSVWRNVNMPIQFAPVLFVSLEALKSYSVAGSDSVQLVLAHELAHAAGLTHSLSQCNLMSEHIAQPALGCTHSLTGAQLEDFCEGWSAEYQVNKQLAGSNQALRVPASAGTVEREWRWVRSQIGAL